MQLFLGPDWSDSVTAQAINEFGFRDGPDEHANDNVRQCIPVDLLSDRVAVQSQEGRCCCEPRAFIALLEGVVPADPEQEGAGEGHNILLAVVVPEKLRLHHRHLEQGLIEQREGLAGLGDFVLVYANDDIKRLVDRSLHRPWQAHGCLAVPIAGGLGWCGSILRGAMVGLLARLTRGSGRRFR